MGDGVLEKRKVRSVRNSVIFRRFPINSKLFIGASPKIEISIFGKCGRVVVTAAYFLDRGEGHQLRGASGKGEGKESKGGE
jgi:hypothetical protein